MLKKHGNVNVRLRNGDGATFGVGKVDDVALERLWAVAGRFQASETPWHFVYTTYIWQGHKIWEL